MNPFDLGRIFKQTTEPEEFETLNEEYKRIWEEASYHEDINIDLAVEKEIWPQLEQED